MGESMGLEKSDAGRNGSRLFAASAIFSIFGILKKTDNF